MTGAGASAPQPSAVRTASLMAAAGGLGVELAADGAGALLRYLDAMLAENAQVNLTAIRDLDTAVVLHALDSLAMALAVDRPPNAVLDLGTGNGFPGVAARALWPRCRLVLCDRTQKKVAAVGRALAAAGCDGVAAVAIDAAQAPALRPEWRTGFDLITVRAVGSASAVAALARPLLRTDGRLLLWLDQATEAEALMGYQPPATHTYELPAPARRTRRLAAYRRIRS